MNAPLSTSRRTVRNRERRVTMSTKRNPVIASIGEAVDALAHRMDQFAQALGGNFIPAGRKSRFCARCGVEAWGHRPGGKAWQHGPCAKKRLGPVSIAPSLLQLGRVGKLYPNATLIQDGNRWTVREPLTGFVRGRGKSRRAALRAAARGAS